MAHDHETKHLKRKIWRQTLLTILAILFVFLAIVNGVGIVAGNTFYNEFCVSYTRFDAVRFQPLQSTLNEGIQTKQWQNVSLNSRLGYSLKGTFLPSPTPSRNTIIFVHGLAGSRLMGLWYAPLYQAKGYNVLVYDSRASGESGGESVTWGYYERYDLDQWVDWVEERFPGGVIGIHGVSMGAATALMHAEMNEATHRVKFYIADSPYSDLEDLLTQQIDAAVSLHNSLWVRLLLRYSSLSANWQSGFRFRDVSPIRSVQGVTTPILYLHGGADVLVPPRMSEQLYVTTKGYKERFVFSDDTHAMSIFNHKAEYRRRVSEFIEAALTK